LSNCNNTVTPTINGSDYTITALNNGTNIWNITGADLDNISNLKFGVNGLPSNTKTLIINVNATGTFNYTPSTFELQRSHAKYIIWNFYNATTLNLSGNVLEGSVLAPLADVTKAVNNIEGQVIAKSYTQNGSGETHVATFEGIYLW
jgi:choice-of-anchor A domain-containing protein